MLSGGMQQILIQIFENYSHSMSVVYIYIYIYMCVCMCVVAFGNKNLSKCVTISILQYQPITQNETCLRQLKEMENAQKKMKRMMKNHHNGT